MVEISEQIYEILRELKESGDVEGSLAIRKDGVVIASDLSDVQTKHLSILLSLFSVAETTSIELKRGVFQGITIESENGKILIVNAGKTAILLSLVKKEGNIGFVMISMESAAKRIDQILTK